MTARLSGFGTEILFVRLPLFVKAPLRVTTVEIGQTFRQALDAMAPHARSHSATSPQGGDDQGEVIVR